MTHPPPYPRTPYLWAPDRIGCEDAVLGRTDLDGWLASPVLVEEKLDGANVAIWFDDGLPRVASRGGPDAMDRAGQMGPLRAWVSSALDRIGSVCGDGSVLYAEWLWLRHTVGYDALPEPLVGLDLWSPATGFLPHGARRDRFDRAGLTAPPLLFDGVLGSVEALLALIGASVFGREPMEGVVLRRGEHETCKVVRPGFVRASDAEIVRVRNGVAT